MHKLAIQPCIMMDGAVKKQHVLYLSPVSQICPSEQLTPLIICFREKDEGSKEIIQVQGDTLSIENVKVC